MTPEDVTLTLEQMVSIAKLLRSYKSLIYSEYEGQNGLIGGYDKEVKRIDLALRELERSPFPGRTP